MKSNVYVFFPCVFGVTHLHPFEKEETRVCFLYFLLIYRDNPQMLVGLQLYLNGDSGVVRRAHHSLYRANSLPVSRS